jgi:TolA-binding protein
MPSPAVILGILLMVALAALAGSGALLKSAWQDVAELKEKYSLQRAETQKAIKQISNLKLEHQKQIHAMDNQLKDNNRQMVELRKQSNAIRNTSTSLQKALEEQPVRAGRITSYLYARGMREICRASSGTSTDCKISLPKSPKTKRNSTTTGGNSPPRVLEPKENPKRKTGLPPNK